MLDAITLDLGCASSQTFVLPDASGLAPLVLPGAFVPMASVSDDEQSLFQQHPSPDAVRRFETAMKPDASARPLRVVAFAPSLAAEKPVEPVAQAVVAEESPVASVKKPEVVATVGKPVAESAEKTVVATVEKPVVVAAVEKPEVSPVEKSTVVVVERPVAVAVEKPVVVSTTAAQPIVSAVVERPVDPVKPADSGSRPVVVAPEQPKAPTVVISQDAPAVVEKPQVAAAVEKPHIVATTEKPKVVATFGKPIAESAEKTVVATVEKPVVVAAVEKPEVVPAEKPTVKPAVVVVERPVVVAVEKPAVVVSEEPVIVETTAAQPIVSAVVERPVDPVKPADSGSQPVVVAPEQPKAPTVVISQDAPAVVEKPQVAAAVERPVVVAVEKPAVVVSEKPVIVETTAAQPIVTAAVERPVGSAETADSGSRPVVVATVEKPVVVTTVEKPEVVPAEKPIVAAIEASTIVPAQRPDAATVERPVVVETTAAQPIASTVAESLVGSVAPANHESQPVAVAPEQPKAPTLVAAPVAQDVIVDKAQVVSDEKSVAVAQIGRPAAVASTENSLAESAEKPVAVTAAEKPGTAVSSEKPLAATVDKQEEKAVAAAAHVVAPTADESPVPQTVQAAPEVAAASAASARTEAIVETVNQIAEAVVGQISVTPGIVHGDCEIKIALKPDVLDGSEIAMTSKDGTLTVHITPATQEASTAAAAALPRLEIALAEHAPAFRHVSVALAVKKGKDNEAV